MQCSQKNLLPVTQTQLHQINEALTLIGEPILEVVVDTTSYIKDKDGEIITEVTGISKTRILSLEELFEIASKTNSNLIEEIAPQKQEGKGRPTRQYRFNKQRFIQTFF